MNRLIGVFGGASRGGAAAASAPTEAERPLPALPAFRQSLKLEDSRYLLEISRRNGSLIRLRDKEGGLELIREPRLGESFRFALPIPGREPWQTIEANWIRGREQRLSAHRLEGRELVLHWAGPLKNYLGVRLEASVTETVELTPRGVRFSLEIRNPGPDPVGEVYFPILGGIQGLGRTKGELIATELIRPAKAGAFVTANIFRSFGNFSWLGDQGPEQFFFPPKDQPAPWVGLASAKAGRAVCLGAPSPEGRDLVMRLELLPGNSATPREDGNWPRPEELRGLPVGVEISLVEIGHGAAPADYHGRPVWLEFLEGRGPQLGEAYAGWAGK
jgi:hypothetical protein